VRNRPVETAGAGSRMSPLRQPRRSVSNAMGAVSSITEDLVAFPSNGGPDRRHLHDGGAQAHRKLEFRPRTGQNHIRLPQSIPLITRNMNPNGKSPRQSFWLYQCDEFVTIYGTAAPTGDPVAQRELFLEKFPALRERRCLLFLGRVHVKKGPDLLMRALAEVLRRRSAQQTDKVHLVMAGPNDHGYGRRMLKLSEELGLQDRITWTGMITGDVKWGAFHAASAFILPSHQENFGISVAEALACRLPVLISNQINIWREIRHEDAGYIETDDLTGTINLIERWLDTPQPAWDAMRERAAACFENRFRVERTAGSLVRAMELFGVQPKPDSPTRR
jgi:glycosyltransferase involved in cell wall biosynthesis